MWFLSPTGVISYILYDWLNILSQPVNVIATWQAVAIGDVALFITLSVRMLSSIFEMIDPSLEEAAESLGASESQMFRDVILPLALPGVVAVAVFVFVRTMAAYVMALVLGGGVKNVNVIPLEIYINVLNIGFVGSLPVASAWAVLLVLVTLIGRFILIWFMRRNFKGYLERQLL
jgi:ABC-type Fe3+ transport system permease subunit